MADNLPTKLQAQSQPVNGQVLDTERPLKWRFEFHPKDGGKPNLVEFDSTAGLVAFMLAGIDVVKPGACVVRYIGSADGLKGLGEIVND